MVVRRDLPPGVAAAQLIHAAGESAFTPVKSGTYAVALTANAAELVQLCASLCAADVRHAAVCEPDQPHNGALLAVGIAPAPKSEVRRYVAQLPLVGREEVRASS